MPWSALIAALVQFFLPLALDWLRDLLERSEPAWRPPPGEAVAVGELFAHARGQLTVWDRLRGRGRLLARLERVATVRASELVRAAQERGDAPVMTTAEVIEVLG